MSVFSLILILVCVIGISIGQILFKLASPFFPQTLTLDTLISFLFNRFLFSALVIYGIATILWVYALKLVPLSIAYPFMALAFVIVPIMGVIFLNEPFNVKTIFGVALIVGGLFVIVK